MKMLPQQGRMAGFTLTEVAIVMVIMGVLVGIGLPSFRYVTTSNRISSEINGLLGDMQFTRSQAIKQGQTVTICASSDSLTCSGSSHWELGWIVCLDPSVTQQCGGLTIIRVQPKFNANDTLVSSVAGYTATSFNRMGYAPTGQLNTFTINLHDQTSTSAWTRCLAVTPAGSVSTEQYGAGTPPCI